MKIRVITVNMRFLAKKCVYLGMGIGNGLKNAQLHLYFIPSYMAVYNIYIVYTYYLPKYIDVFHASSFTTQIAYKPKKISVFYRFLFF